MDFLKQYLVENNMKMKVDNIKEKFICKLCGDVLHEAKVTPCGCMFCNKCISTYLGNETKKCPRCEKIYISMVLLVEDYRIRNKISNISIVCPRKECTEIVLMKDIECHLLNCDKKKSKCVLSGLGCCDVELCKDEMDSHFVRENETHFKLVCNKISEESNGKRVFEEETKRKMMNLETKQEEIEVRANGNNQEIMELRQNMVRKDEEVETLKQNFKKDEEVETLKQNFKKDEEVETLKQNFKNKDETLKQNFKKKDEVETLKQQIKAAFEKIEEMKTKTATVKNTKSTQTEEEKKKIIQESVSCRTEEEKKSNLIKDDLRIIEGRECQVVFTNMNLRVRNWDYLSDLFCIEKYCFVMRMWYHSGGDIGVAIYLQRGPFDGEIEWPLKKSIEISLLNKNKVKIETQFNKDMDGVYKARFNKPGPNRYRCIL